VRCAPTQQRNLVANIAEKFLPLYRSTHGRLGYVSIQGDPLHEDAETIIRHARINRKGAPPNIMAKIPATPHGFEAMDILLREGVPVNATEVMCVRQALDVCEVYAKATADMDLPPMIYYSHIAGIFDEHIRTVADREKIDVSPDALHQAGLAVARKIQRVLEERGYFNVGFISGGARGLHHFIDWVGSRACVTINWLGTAKDILDMNPPVVQTFLAPTPESVLEELIEKIPDFRKAFFTHSIEPEEYENYGPVALFRSMFMDAWTGALDIIAKRRAGK
jgi:transaldolase